MKCLYSHLLLTTLALATPVPDRRQSSLARITSAALTGTGCPSDTFTSELSEDGQVITLGFDTYQTLVGPSADPDDREKTCDVAITINYPLGCTVASLSTTYHGFAQLEPGVTGTFAAQYNISPGSLSGDGASPFPVTVSSHGFGGDGNVFTKVDEEINSRVEVRNQHQRDVQFVVRSRIFVQARNGDVGGLLTQDDITVAIDSQGGC